RRLCLLDAPLEPVIGLAGGETRWRGTTVGLLLRRLRGFQRRIVYIALGAPAVERRLVPFVQRCAALQALDQVGVGDERLAERDQVGAACREYLGRKLDVIAVIRDVGAAKTLAQ